MKSILNIIKKEAYVNQRQLSEASGYSLGKVNTSLAELVKAGYLNADYRLTEQAKELFTENRPNQAVILAAGAGMRMIPINTEVSKGMLEVRGETLVERLIKQLKEKGIHKITIVVGFMKEQYEYLIDEYGVELVLLTRKVSTKSRYLVVQFEPLILDNRILYKVFYGEHVATHFIVLSVVAHDRVVERKFWAIGVHHFIKQLNHFLNILLAALVLFYGFEFLFCQCNFIRADFPNLLSYSGSTLFQ